MLLSILLSSFEIVFLHEFLSLNNLSHRVYHRYIILLKKTGEKNEKILTAHTHAFNL